jgi:Ca2+/Na+ antiporter
MSNVSENNKRRPSLLKKILVIILLVLQIISLIFSISQTLAKELDLPYRQAIFYFVIIFLSGLVIFFLISYKKWRNLIAYILVMLVLIILTQLIKNRIEKIEKRRIELNEKNRQEEIEDMENQFEKSDQIINVIISNFKSPAPKDGAAFANKLQSQLSSKTTKPLQISLRDTTLSVEIKIQKVEGVWDTTKMKIRGKRREADLGITGNYIHYLEKGQRKEEVSDFKVIILDTLIANIFKEGKPFGDIYEFIVNIEDISVPYPDSFRVEEKAVLPIEYIIKTAGTTKLLQHAIKINRWNRNQTLSTINQKFSDLGKLIRNPSLACFHQGNSLVRAAMNKKLSLDKQRELFKEAARAYKKSIGSLSSVQQKTPLKLNYPERIYLNRAWTYMRLDSLTGDSAFKDSAEAVYDSVVVQYPSRETLEEQISFLAQCCEEEFAIQKIPLRIERAEQLYSKYEVCADKLELEIRTKSLQPSKEDQEILNTIENNKKYFMAHLTKLRQL